MKAALGIAMAIALAATFVLIVRHARPGHDAPPRPDPDPSAPGTDTRPGPQAPTEAHMTARRLELTAELREQGIKDPAVLAAISRVPRHRFVPGELAQQAYENHPLPIGRDQTISQPYIVAFMTEAAKIRPGANVLEVGTGSGYQAAVLAEMLGLVEGSESTARLASIEIIEELGLRADRDLKALGYRVDVRIGDGYRGWPERAPFDAILVTAAPDHVPQPLVDQLAPGGRMVIPVGEGVQDMWVLTRDGDRVTTEKVLAVRFVPMTGEAMNGGR